MSWGVEKDITPFLTYGFIAKEGVNSWFCTLLNAYNDFVSDERVVWVDIEGVRLYLVRRTQSHGAKILNDGAQNSDVESDDECNVDGVSETIFSDNVDECNVDGHDGPTNGEDMVNMPRVDAKVMDHSQEVHDSSNGESVSSFHIKIKRLGHKTKKEWVKELNCKHRINFLALQETKMDCISHMDVKSLWGNSNFDFVASDSLGNSGGILCIWEASIFKKDGATISDNFIAIYGTWLPRNVKILLVAVYVSSKTAWEHKGSLLAIFLSNLVRDGNGEAIIMGDFNDVRTMR
ncbi:RNA-directed DNA polymerase, eukaryota [Tanacetum coccineum]